MRAYFHGDSLAVAWLADLPCSQCDNQQSYPQILLKSLLGLNGVIGRIDFLPR
jgi:hypothetical protein